MSDRTQHLHNYIKSQKANTREERRVKELALEPYKELQRKRRERKIDKYVKLLILFLIIYTRLGGF